jgi:hypothetical protein
MGAPHFWHLGPFGGSISVWQNEHLGIIGGSPGLYMGKGYNVSQFLHLGKYLGGSISVSQNEHLGIFIGSPDLNSKGGYTVSQFLHLGGDILFL